MVKGLWNYAIKVANLECATRFYAAVLGAEVRLRGEVLGCVYTLIRLGGIRVILFEKAPYKDLLGKELPQGFLHDVYEVDDFDAQIARLRKAGVCFLMEPQVIEAEFGTGESRSSRPRTACVPRSWRFWRMLCATRAARQLHTEPLVDDTIEAQAWSRQWRLILRIGPQRTRPLEMAGSEVAAWLPDRVSRSPRLHVRR